MKCELASSRIFAKEASIQGSSAKRTNEETLILAARGGNGRAFGDLVAPYLPMLYRIAMRICRKTDLAEDAVQETLTIAFQQLHKYESNTNFRAFIATIATKRIHTLIRSENRRRKRELKSASRSPRPANPLQLNEAEQTAETIRAALHKMPAKRRNVVLLRIEAGLSYSEIAEELGGSKASARVLAHLAMKELKDELEKHTLL